jgi:DNA-binding response OmpR family regulator
MDEATKKILIIEDEHSLSLALKLKLSHEGYAVDTAADGDEGLRLLGTNIYDVIILDLVMPKIDGFAVLTELKTRHLQTKIIVISNLNQSEDLVRVKELGASEYLVKSNVTLAEIITVIKKYI